MKESFLFLESDNVDLIVEFDKTSSSKKKQTNKQTMCQWNGKANFLTAHHAETKVPEQRGIFSNVSEDGARGWSQRGMRGGLRSVTSEHLVFIFSHLSFLGVPRTVFRLFPNGGLKKVVYSSRHYSFEGHVVRSGQTPRSCWANA